MDNGFLHSKRGPVDEVDVCFVATQKHKSGFTKKNNYNGTWTKHEL